MTVADIKGYIEICLREPQGRYMYKQRVRMLESNLRKIKSMLDELEQPIEIDTEKYFEQIDKLVDKEMTQYLKDQMKKSLKKDIEKGE